MTNPTKLQLPFDYTSVIEKSRWKPPFGYHFKSQKRIEIYPCKFIPTWFGLREKANTITWNHEATHAWGISGCNKPWCLMFELKIWNPDWKKNGWVEKLIALTGIFSKFSLCKKCNDKLNSLINLEDRNG